MIEANREFAEALPAHHTSEYGAFKVRDKLFVDKIKPQTGRIWSMEYCEGFIAEDALIGTMLADFSGVERADVLHYRTKKAVPGWAGFPPRIGCRSWCRTRPAF